MRGSPIKTRVSPFLLLIGCSEPGAVDGDAESSPSSDSRAEVTSSDSVTPIGYLDRIDETGTAFGWTLSPAQTPASIDVSFTVDRGEQDERSAGTVTANVPRPDVNQATGLPGDHGFSFRIPNRFRDGVSHALSAFARAPVLFYKGNDARLFHRSGFAVDTSWATDVSGPTNSFISYGPYTDQLAGGHYTARFTMLVDNNSADNWRIVTIDVNDTHSGVLASRDINRTDFTVANAPVNFDLPFVAPAGASLEFRILYGCCSFLQHVGTAIYPDAAPSVQLGSSPIAFQLDPLSSQPSRAQVIDSQGDLMIWGGPEFALDCRTGQDPETGIRCSGDDGGVPRGLHNGWVWSLSIPRYSPARREALYQKILGYGYTHLTIQVTRCVPGAGYHGLYPVTAADCAANAERLNTVLQEIRDHNLITWCAGLSPDSPPEDGLDRSLCDATLDDWDNTDQKDCRIDAIARWFPDAWHFVELPEASFAPRADACTPPGLLPAGNGTAWIQDAQRRDPRLVGMLIEVNQPEGHERNLAKMQLIRSWWGDFPQNRFELDTYWKFWDNYSFADSKLYNDWFNTNAPWLQGFMSGGSAHPPPN